MPALLRPAVLCLAAVAVLAGCRAPGPDLRVSWEPRPDGTDGFLTITGEDIPGGEVRVWYIEAYCRSGSTDRDWRETVIPHRSELVEADPEGRWLRLRTRLPWSAEEGGESAPVVIEHTIETAPGEVRFDVVAENRGREYVDVVWAQPCIRVGEFTGLGQEDYIRRSFIFLEGGLTTLDKTRRAEEARYRGGQVYVPPGIDLDDVNPRPISPDVPANGLIGCFSAGGRWLLATAWEPYQELFQGVIVCLHSDFRIGGLGPGETKRARGRIYILPNDPELLLERYRRDFPEQARGAAALRSERRAGGSGAIDTGRTAPADAEERRFYESAARAIEAVDGLRLFELADQALRKHPERRELHLLRALGVLLAAGAVEEPIRVLETGGGRAVPFDLALYALEELEAGLFAGSSGSSYDEVRTAAAGELLQLWALGFAPWVRWCALEEGRVDVYEALAPSAPTLVDELHRAQLLALRGRTEEAEEILQKEIPALLEPERYERLKPHLERLSGFLDSIAGKPAGVQSAALKAFELAVSRDIPELAGAHLALPEQAVAAVKGGADPPALERLTRPDDVRKRLEAVRAEPSQGAKELASALFEAVRRLHDVRPDVIRRALSGDGSAFLAAERLAGGVYVLRDEGRELLRIVPEGAQGEEPGAGGPERIVEVPGGRILIGGRGRPAEAVNDEESEQ